MILSNTSLDTIRNQVRTNALEDFGFFANNVLAARLPEDLCAMVQDVVRDEEDYYIRTSQPRMLCVALHGWLESKGVSVLTAVPLKDHEILKWLDLSASTDVVDRSQVRACTIEVRDHGVLIQWL